MATTFYTHPKALPPLRGAGRSLPQIGGDRARRLHRLADWLDTRFAIPGLGLRIGLDGLIGLIPGIGDTVSTLISLYIFREARAMRIPRHVQARMIGNIAMDWMIGLVPLAGDIFDIAHKANAKNVRLLLSSIVAEPHGR